MALKVWLPLNGDLTQQGISDITATSTNTTITTAGKIGQCYTFNGSSSYIKLSNAPLNNNNTEFSFACWFKPINTHHGCLFSNRTKKDSTGITLFYYSNQIIFDTYNRWQFTPSTSITVGQWNHLTFTYKRGDKKKLYLNGILINETTASSTAPTSANTSNAFIGGGQNSQTTVNANWINGNLNDVRIYDHCLSAAEVREISQGLVLHYKLDDITNGIQDSSGYNHNGSYVNTTITPSEARYSNCISCLGTTVDGSSNTITGAQFFYCNIDMPTMGAITISWWGKNTQYGRGGIFETSGSVQTDTTKGSDHSSTAIANWDTTFRIYNGSSSVNFFSNFNKDGNWHHHVITFDGTNAKYYCDNVLKQTGALTGTLPAWKSFCMGLGKASGVWRQIKQYVNDLRIYCTALDADAIRQLYEVGAKIDNKQNFHTFELIENNSKIQINKQGQTLCNELHETTATKLHKTNQIIETNEIIEL